MSALLKLWWFKQKGFIRNLYRKPSSAIFTTLLVLFYGAIIVSSFIFSKKITTVISLDVHIAIMSVIGYAALMLLLMLMQSKKALFYEEDAFYLFSGPFTKKSQMRYLLGQTAMNSILYALLALFVGFMSFIEVHFAPFFLFITFITIFLVNFFFMILVDYLYVLAICYPKYKNLAKYCGIAILVTVAGLIGYQVILEGSNPSSVLQAFIQTDSFYIVPIFGWAKLILVSFIEQNYLYALLGLCIILIPTCIVYFLFTSFKGKFYEKALLDASEISKIKHDAKAGNLDTMAKVKNKGIRHSTFYLGAWAILSKTILQMEKTRQLFSISEVLILGLYILIGIMSGVYEMVVYMLVIYLVVSPQNSQVEVELKNYMLYLIPDSPLKKLLALLIPSFIKTSLATILSLIIAGLILQVEFSQMLYYILMFLGYSCVSVMSNILALKILKSRSNKTIANFLKTLIMLLCMIPSLGIMIFMIIELQIFDTQLFEILNYVPLVLNFVISAVILFFCRNMLNGQELMGD